MTTAPAILFQTTIVPHRSLSSRGMLVVISAICSFSAIISTVCWLLGAWPIAGFSGAEVALAIALLRYNARGSRASEMLLLSEEGLRIIRTDVKGVRRERALPAGWLQVVLEKRPGRVSGLYLRAYGRSEEIAAALGETEKTILSEALREALHQWRNPVFRNEQLESP